MIVNGILLVFQGFLNILLLPVTAIDITIDFISSIPIVTQFLQVITYILPWRNILPIIAFIILLTIFKTTISLIKLIINFIPFY